ncbi:MAG: hypothetical protein K2O67_04440, partial [Clostridia bacterium]|nr:hypothetical protein [Clostridia bacterium]
MSSFDASGVTQLTYMFQNVNAIKKIKLSDTLVNKLKSLNDSLLVFPLYDSNGTRYTAATQLTKGGAYFSSPHTHSYVLTSQQNATCLEDGEKISTCSEPYCADVKTEILPKINGEHSWGAWVDKTPANCTTDKVQEKTCSRCGKKEEQSVTGTMLGHLYGDPEWEWTDNHGSATAKFTCTREDCGYLHSLPATVTQTTQRATCLAEGKTTYTATLAVNGAEFEQSTYTDTQEVPIAQLNHIAGTTWSKDSSNHWHLCTLNCGTKLDEVAHTFDIWKVDTPATVTTTGIGHYECVCGERGADEEIPKETCAHTNKTHVAAQAATCVATGNPEYWTCNSCGKNLDSTNSEIATIVIPIDPNNHVSWGSW